MSILLTNKKRPHHNYRFYDKIFKHIYDLKSLSGNITFLLDSSLFVMQFHFYGDLRAYVCSLFNFSVALSLSRHSVEWFGLVFNCCRTLLINVVF